ncbi:Acyl carrier protein 1, chloroplastic-like protein [Drosera capensis]
MKKARVRTIIPAEESFEEDCARILRAIRIAARLGFHLDRETAKAVKSLSTSILRLDKTRLMMEMNYMLAYGSAEASLRLLWKFGLLEILLPVQAAYLVANGFRRRDKRSNMLLSLFSNLDKLVAPDRPCHCSIWVAILALHKALADRPRDPLVVATFSLAVYNGGDLVEAVKIARSISQPHECSFHELLEPLGLDSTMLKEEVLDLEESVKAALSMMTDESVVSKAMAAYPHAPFSDLVFIPLGLYLRVCKIFECVRKGPENDFVPKQGGRIDYEALATGTLEEVRRISSSALPLQVNGRASGRSLVSRLGWKKSGFATLKSSSSLQICHAVMAKPETVDKVCHIVRKQLALPPETELTGESKFTTLGADSLDTVEIVMGLEEEFGISVEEESSQNITTVQEAADLIEKLVGNKCEA